MLRFWDPTVLHALNAVCPWKSERELFRVHLNAYEDRNYVDFIPAVIAGLHKPGVPAEQRFEMLMQATRKRQQQMKEKR
ncbi:hypothetical protein AB3X96_00350 [Paraburkholderia sp. BR13439]|uniref:hypothetical protein n=1 Tax=Paraburkholderia sp. BR13439 TaxID=3236996 RepID=UPI0034CD0C9E